MILCYYLQQKNCIFGIILIQDEGRSRYNLFHIDHIFPKIHGSQTANLQSMGISINQIDAYQNMQ